ncbi:J domain-containing protein [Nocardioides kribbensis]|uniref:J domain-containing protein n=1 Tax=Nocardioides kribbensis TaxID=305517 RepID=UPI001879B2E3|nr:J domain-containing protein [Nocardioides kribbensis]
MTPSWYDVLGVDPDASTEEVRAAWRAAIADLDPADRRFRSLNQAAEVLLDPERRAAYDATLEPDAGLDADPATGTDPGPDGRTAAPLAAGGPSASRPPRSPRVVPGWSLVVAGVLAVALAALTVLALVSPAASGEADAEEAREVAVRAIVPVLSYDYRSMDESAAAASTYMTSAFKTRDYDPLFAVLQENVAETETVVEAEVVDSGVVRTGEDRVEVLLFVDQPTTNVRFTEPQTYQNRVVVTMVKDGEDWLIDKLVTTGTGPAAGE